MLLALDAGNSNITIGAFDGRKMLAQWRLRTVHDQTADEWGILLRNLFSLSGPDIEKVNCSITAQPAQHQPRDGSRRLIRNGKDRTDVDLAQDVVVFA